MKEIQASEVIRTSQEAGEIHAVGENIPIPNREYKSTVFSLLYQDKEKLLNLYNALNHSHHSKPEELTIVTLENAIYMAMKNDKAFLLEHRLNMYEHQSTPNPNLPLRDLFYVSREYEKLVVRKSLYGRKKVKIPAPHFVVFYNGTTRQPERQLLRLSDLYEVPEENPMLELVVEFLNINQGLNLRLKEECPSLGEYMLFVDKIRKYADREGKALKDAVEQAVMECIKEGILAEFLEANRREVVAVSIFEYDEEKELELLRQAEYALGVEDGEKIGQERGEQIGQERGEQIGQERGEQIGEKRGEEKGLKALVTSLQQLLPDFETVYQAVTANKEYEACTKEQVDRYYQKDM